MISPPPRFRRWKRACLALIFVDLLLVMPLGLANPHTVGDAQHLHGAHCLLIDVGVIRNHLVLDDVV